MGLIGLSFSNPGPMLIPFSFKIAQVIYAYILLVKISANRTVIARAPPLLPPQTHSATQRELTASLVFSPEVFLYIYTYIYVHIEMCGFMGLHV